MFHGFRMFKVKIFYNKNSDLVECRADELHAPNGEYNAREQETECELRVGCEHGGMSMIGRVLDGALHIVQRVC